MNSWHAIFVWNITTKEINHWDSYLVAIHVGVSVWLHSGVSEWWNRSMFLGTHRITEFKTNENENGIMLVMELFKMKFSLSAVEQMKLYTDTQIREASNRLLSVSLPKNVNFSKTMPGRASSTIHRLNNGPSNYTPLLMVSRWDKSRRHNHVDR